MWISLLLAIAIHELGHVAVARRLGMRLTRLSFTATGLCLTPTQGSFPSYRAECAVALGGPLANVLSALLVWLLLPSPAVPADFVALSLYLAALNMLPLRPFDGGRVLLCLLCHCFCFVPDRAERVLSGVSAVILLVLWLAAVYLVLRRGSALSLYLFCLQLGRRVLWENDCGRVDQR